MPESESPTPSTAPHRTLVDLSPLKASLAFARLWIGQSISGIGAWMTMTAVGLIIFDIASASMDGHQATFMVSLSRSVELRGHAGIGVTYALDGAASHLGRSLAAEGEPRIRPAVDRAVDLRDRRLDDHDRGRSHHLRHRECLDGWAPGDLHGLAR